MQVAYLPIHCNLIQTCCNAIQALLQVNSNNYNRCAFWQYFAVAVDRGRWREMEGNGDICWGLLSPKLRETRLARAELTFSAAGFALCNRLILRDPSRLFVHFSRTHRSDAGQNPVTYSTQVAYVMNRCLNLERSCEPLTNLQNGQPL